MEILKTKMTESESVIFDVCGKKIKVSKKTILQRNRGLLFDLISEFKDNKEIEIDENKKIFDAILDYYRSGILEKPKNISLELWKNRTDFWGVSFTYSDMDYQLYFIGSYLDNLDMTNKVGILHAESGSHIIDLEYPHAYYTPFVHSEIYFIIGMNRNQQHYTMNLATDNLTLFKDMTKCVNDKEFRKIEKKDLPEIKIWLEKTKKNRDLNLENSYFNRLFG